MSFLDFFRKEKEKQIEKQKIENRSEPLPVDESWVSLFSGINGIDVNKAMNIPAFASSVNMISSAVAMIPVKLYKSNEANVANKTNETNEGKATSEVSNDQRIMLLNDDTGDTLSGVEFKRAMVRDYLVFGNAYAFINKSGKKIKSINYVSANNVSVISSYDPIFKDYDIQVQGKQFKPFEFLKLLRVTEDGATGKGILQENKELLSTAYSILSYQQNLVEKNGNKKGFINAKTRLSKESMDAIRKSVEQLYNDSERNIIVLNEGLDFKESSNTSVEMQLNENKKSLNNEIKSVFGINIGTDGKTDYYDFLKNAVMPVISEFECSLNRDLLRESEKKEYYFAFDTKEVIKNNLLFKSSLETYKTLIDANIMQIDEVRYMLDLKPLGLDFIKLGLQDVLYNPKTKEVFTPNTGQKISTEKIEYENENKAGDSKSGVG
ncbi:MAG: phage portal protein [Oscillospiraceae bacterium]|nr:phage portal protein [Oscillospiraceae bacterium]